MRFQFAKHDSRSLQDGGRDAGELGDVDAVALGGRAGDDAVDE